MGDSDSSEGDATDPMIGRVIASRFRIEKKLGAGAMGGVYRARHVKVGRLFAIKILHVDLLEDSKLKRRFMREAELAGTLSHSNVVTVTDVGESEGLHYIAMEYAKGPTLGDVISQHAPMPAARVMLLVGQLLDGLHHAHKRGLIHRDFKPENVIVVTELDGKESPRIVDFGIAIVRDDASSAERERLTTVGITLGTPHYMAPEHVTGQAIDHRIDLFAIGVVLYEMLCGAMPFDGDGVDVARANLLEETPSMAERAPLVTVDPLLEAFTRKLMSKAPDARPATAKDARALLDLIARDRAAAAAALGVAIEPSIEPAKQSPAPSTPASPGAPVYGRYTPPTPYLAVAQPLTSSPSGQHAIVEPPPTGAIPVAIATASSSRTRSPRPQAQLPRTESQPGMQPPVTPPLPRADSQPGVRPPLLHPASQPGLLRNPSGPVSNAPSRRARSDSAKRAMIRMRRMWIVIAIAALALGAILALLLR